MQTQPAPNLQRLRDRRRRADEWIDYARWTAIGTAAFGTVLVLLVGLTDLSIISQVVPVISSLVAQGLVGSKLKDRSQWAAWGLMATYIASFAVTVIVYGVWSGVLVKAAIGYVYTRGWLATLDYEDLTTQITNATAAQSGDAA
jgi:hypothetical protein